MDTTNNLQKLDEILSLIQKIAQDQLSIMRVVESVVFELSQIQQRLNHFVLEWRHR